MAQASDAVRSAVDGLAVTFAMQGPALMEILDKSLPTAAGLAGESWLAFESQLDFPNGVCVLVSLGFMRFTLSWTCFVLAPGSVMWNS
jgi:hypothetical protein